MSTLARMRALPRPTKVLLVTNAVNSFGGGLVLPFLWVYLSEVRHLGTWVVAATLAIRAVAAILGGLGWGSVLDRVPYRVVVPLVMTIAGAGTSLYAFAATAPLAITAAVVYGIGIAGVGTVLRSTYARTTTAEQRGLAYSLDYGIFNAMSGVGVVVGGFIATAPFASAAARYGLLYLGDGVTFLLTGLVATVLLRSDRTEATAPTPAKVGERTGYLAVLSDRRLLATYGVLLAALLVSNGQYTSGLPGFLTGRHAIDALGLSFITTFNIIAVVVLQFLVMPYLRKVTRTRLLAISGIAFAGFWAFIGLAGQYQGITALVYATAGVALMSVGEVLVVPVANTLVNNLVGDDLRGRANALLSTTTSTSSVVGPVIAGAALPFAGGLPLIIVLIAASAVALLLAVRLGRIVPDTANREEEPVGEPEAALQASA